MSPQSLRRVFTPLVIRGVEIPNRIARTGHLTKFALGAVSDDLIAYHRERARGGVGLTILEACAVHPSSVLALSSFDDSVIPGYRALMAAVNPYGMRVFAQLWHGGHVYSAPGGGPPRGASSIASPVSGIPAVPLSAADIAELVAAYGAAARRSVEGGIDGVEVHAGHGYLVHQFLSPLTNNRVDEYGGDIDRRMQFLREILTEVRAVVGPGVPIGVRAGAGQVPGDITEDDVIQVCRRLEAEGLIDFVNATMGDYYAMHWMIGGMDRPAGYMLASSGQVTKAVSGVARIVTGRFRTLEEAEQVLKEGAADIVSMVRAHIADPDLMRKARHGHPEQVRPCIGCNQGCLARTSGVDLRMACTVNPAVGFESTLSEHQIGRTISPLKVLIVGGGPAGMEAARTARLRGHNVDLFEAYPKLGGALNVAVKAPRMPGFEDIVEWLRYEVQRHGVKVQTNSYMEADDVLGLSPDVVIVATGAEPFFAGRLTAFPGHVVDGYDRPHVVSGDDILTRRWSEIGQRALVYDDIGSYEAVAVTEFLLSEGVAAIVATRHPAWAPLVEAAQRMEPALQRLHAYGPELQIFTRCQLLAIEPGKATIYDGAVGVEREVTADTVVIVTHRRSRSELAGELTGRIPDVKLVGDALSARDLQVAIREGHMAGRAIP